MSTLTLDLLEQERIAVARQDFQSFTFRLESGVLSATLQTVVRAHRIVAPLDAASAVAVFEAIDDWAWPHPGRSVHAVQQPDGGMCIERTDGTLDVPAELRFGVVVEGDPGYGSSSVLPFSAVDLRAIRLVEQQRPGRDSLWLLDGLGLPTDIAPTFLDREDAEGAWRAIDTAVRFSVRFGSSHLLRDHVSE